MGNFIPQMFASTLIKRTTNETMIRAYTVTFPDRASCIGAIAFPRDISVGNDHPNAVTMRSFKMFKDVIVVEFYLRFQGLNLFLLMGQLHV